jgi:hypothetical protein
MDLYTRNVLVGVFAVLVMGTVLAGEVIAWAHYDIDIAKEMVQKIGLGLSVSGTLVLVCAYLKETKKLKKKAGDSLKAQR